MAGHARRRAMWVSLVATASVGVACATSGSSDGPTRGFSTAPGAMPGLGLEVVAAGLRGPTQIAPDGAGGFVVAELNGGERDGTGRILRFRSLPGPSEVLLEGLLTPTGVAVEQGLLWVMERRRLSVGPLDDPSDRRVVLDEMSFNGRSQGTVTPVPGGGVLFDTSGRRDDRSPTGLAPGSGTLWYVASPDAEPEVWATGLKHAYAHTRLDDERWLVTEIADGRLDGSIPPDELVIAAAGDDFGHPQCIGDQRPVLEAGGNAARCASTPRSLALFDPGATPTGVAIAPWDPSSVFVALWTRGEVVVVRLDQPAGAVEVALAAFDRPQHLLADGHRILLTDHGTGEVIAITRSGIADAAKP